jgi:ATP-dependent DNA helicase RecQ
MADLDAARKILTETFGFDDFLPGQAEAIGALLDGEDVFALWPTGGGKSLVYQLPAMARPGLTVVVSPLIALMRDQARKLKKRGLSAAALHADQDAAAYRKICEEVERGRLSLLYLSPERLANPETLALLRAADVSLLAVDEAHCVSQWGHDFRPDYRKIAAASEALGFPQMVAATATAAPHTRADIVENLFARPPRVIAGSFRRKAIALSALPQTRDPTRQILELVEARRGRSGIIYCASRKSVDFVAQALNSAGHPAAAYHAGLAAEIREARQDEFLDGADRVMVATIAFGLGVDKPDVRYVIHRDAPDHLETLYQETGRAGRDGQPAEAIALFAPAVVAELRGARFEIARIDAASARRAKMLAHYFTTTECREKSLLAALGEDCPPCGQCDNCRRGFKKLRRLAGWVGAAPGEARVLVEHALHSGVAFFSKPAVEHDFGHPEQTPQANADFAADFGARKWPARDVEESRRWRCLHEARRQIARKSGVAPARLVGDAALARLIATPPADLAQLIAICGDETGLLARFGAPLVACARRERQG